jgi:CubicO group peptidase (beta-lactamase class C family)
MEAGMNVDEDELRSVVTEAAEELGVPGVSVGVYQDGTEAYAFHGVTSVENPLPVDTDTLFQFGSTGKTFTATAIMRLVDRGRVDLEATVRTYVPELKLKDEDVAQRVTVLHLLNHTAGWQGDFFPDTGEGDDALAKYVEKMADLEQEFPLGATAAYNDVALSLAGRVIEKVTGETFEQAIKSLLFEPLGLTHSFFFPNEIMTRRFAVGHTQHPDGSITVSRPWMFPRGASPGGGISSNAADQVAWARFHLGDGTAPDGTLVLSEELLKRMQKPTVETPGSALGDAIGIIWRLRDVDGVRLVSHGGDTRGQHSAFEMVPERDFAIAVLTNCGPNGIELHEQLVRWALEAYVGVVDRDPEPVALSPSELAPYTGRYETIAWYADVTVEDQGLMVAVASKPEAVADLTEDEAEEVEEPPPFRVGLLPGPGDRYVALDGPFKGMKGYFAREAGGAVDGVHLGGRLATRTAPEPAPRPG